MSDVNPTGEVSRDRVYPVLPLRDIVVFPGMIVPLFVGREKSVKALEEVMRDDKHILVVTQKNAQDDDPAPDQIYSTGTIATVLQLLKLPDGTVKVLVEGLSRATIDNYLQTEEYFEAEASPLSGMKLVGFAVWERRDGGRNVTFPARQYSVNGERRSFALLRPANGCLLYTSPSPRDS